MRPGYLYILSNPIFPADVLKIGLTRDDAEERAKGLSRSSSIPLNFKVERAIAVQDVGKAERRVHLLLEPKRISSSKEFFRLDLAAAIDMCLAIAAYEQEDDTVSPHIGLSPRLLGAHYYPDTTLRTKKLIYLLIAATTNNTFFDRISRQRRGVADGFLTTKQVCEYFEVGPRAAAQSMRKLAVQGLTTSCRRFAEPPIEAIFEFIRYHKGHLAWKFTDEFRDNFHNPKI